jgi:hypothetical protein
MKYTMALVLALLMAWSAGAAAQQTKTMTMTDFSGEWVMNVEKSGFEQDREGHRRLNNPITMTVTQDDKELVVVRMRKGRDGEDVKTILTYSLKGKKTKNKTDFGTMESTVKWIEEGTKLELVSSTEVKREGMKFNVENLQTWSLDGDVLTIDTVRNTPRGEIKSTAVYERKGTQTRAAEEKEKE